CDARRVLTSSVDPKEWPVVFMFPGQGAQHVDMCLDLYLGEPTFHAQLDQCSELLKQYLDLDLREVLYPPRAQREQAGQLLLHTAVTQPALFTVEYALAKLWMEWGIYPKAMIGHSTGEYVAACLAGVMSLEQALALVAIRGRLMGQMLPGAMVAIAMSEEELQPFLSHDISLGAVNGPFLCVLSGSCPVIERLSTHFASQGVHLWRVRTSHAFHSS